VIHTALAIYFFSPTFAPKTWTRGRN